MQKTVLRFFTAAVGLAALFPSASSAAPGDLYVATGNQAAFKYSPDGTQVLYANNIGLVEGVAFDGRANMYMAIISSAGIKKFPPGNPTNTLFAGGLDFPTGLVFDSFGTLYETDNNSGNIFQFTPAGAKSTFSGGLNKPTGIAIGPDGRVYVSEPTTGTVYRYTQGGGGIKIRTVFASGLTSPQGLAFDAAGNLFIADSGTAAVLKVLPDGTKTTFASGIVSATGLAFDGAGNLFVTEFINNGPIIQITPAGQKSTFVTVTNAFPKWLAFEPTLHSLLNISTRAFVQTGDNVLIGGFIMNGNGQVNQDVVVRATGPSLGAFGVPSPLLDPTLELHGPDNAIIATNDNWRQNSSSVQTLIQSLGLAPSDDRESVIYATLPAGHYTAVVRGAGTATGNALVEVYNIQ